MSEKRKEKDSLLRITALTGKVETSADAGHWKGVEEGLAVLRPLGAKLNAPMRARFAVAEGRWHWAAKLVGESRVGEDGGRGGVDGGSAVCGVCAGGADVRIVHPGRAT